MCTDKNVEKNYFEELECNKNQWLSKNEKKKKLNIINPLNYILKY